MNTTSSFHPLLRRILFAYMVILGGLTFFLLRRLIFPIEIEAGGLPIDIAVSTVLQLCYETPELATCIDPALVMIVGITLIVGVGWGNLVAGFFTIILALPAFSLYFMSAPAWWVLAALLLIPLEVGFVLFVGFRDYAF